LLLYPDHPYGLGTLYGAEFDPELKRNVRFVIAETQHLPEEQLYSKERKLIEEIKKELAEGRRCQVFAVYTQKHDVTARLQRILNNEGIRTAVLKSSVDTTKREAWYARQIKEGVQVVISHPKLVETGPCVRAKKSDSNLCKVWVLRTRIIIVRPPERRKVPAEVQFEVAPNAVTDITDLRTACLRTWQG